MDFCYKHPPITKLSTLARILRIEEHLLVGLAENADKYYKIGSRKKKPDGTERITYDAKPPLKSVHARIKCLILRNITFPPYLHGGIGDPVVPRDYVSSARTHQSAKTLVCEDIQQFFPSVQADVIRDIWEGLLHFSPVVANCLTKLTTKDGALPQGAKTSTALANLVFWREEPGLVAYFRSKGIEYTRFIDDINCSSKSVLDSSELADVVRRIHSMCAKYRLRLKRSKHKVSMSGMRMVTTKLIVNRRVSLPREERSAIRGAVKKLEVDAQTEQNKSTLWYGRQFRSLSGKVGKLKRFHPVEAVELRERLRAISPC